MARKLQRNARGVRTPVPAGYIVGRSAGTGTGNAQLIPLTDVTQQLAAAGVPLSGNMPAIAPHDLLANLTGSTAPPIGNTLTATLDTVMGSAEGSILQRGASSWQVLTPGTTGNVLTTQGASALATWSPTAVTGITQLTGDVTAGPGTGSQAATLANTAVTAGSYTLASLTVDAKGRLTAASNGSLPAIASHDLLANLTGSTAAPIGNTLTATLDTVMGSAEGSILQRGASSWQVLTPGTSGLALLSGGASALLNFGSVLTIATANVGGTVSTGSLFPTFVMAGFGAAATPSTYTPVKSGNMLIFFSGYNAAAGAYDIFSQIRYGTGTAPAAGAAPTGSDISALSANQMAFANQALQTLMLGTVTGLTVGTSYWFDMKFAASNSGNPGTATLGNPFFYFIEL